MSKANQFVQAVTKSPLLWGALASVGFYALILSGPEDAPIVKILRRYFAGHPVEYMETVLFAVGLAALLIKLFDTVAQRAGLNDSLLGKAAKTSQPAEECKALLAKLDKLPGRRQGEYYISRLRAALDYVRRRGSADSLDDRLMFLADGDAARLHNSYGLFRVIVWAIPILGFLGTVIGITMMLGGVAEMATGADQSPMYEIFRGLGLKFDTTALALALSMVLMFVHFMVERTEMSLLDQVNLKVEDELLDRFASIPTGVEGPFVAARRVAESMVQATEFLVQRQTELWRAAVEAAGQQWMRMSDTAAEQVRTAMSSAVGELSGRAEMLQNAVQAAGEVAKLEDALNRNLSALSGAKHFEQTVLSLAAAVNMLSARLTETTNAPAPIRLEPIRRASNAA
jgi:biopolymer transport protein ExbB/TolQ